MRVRFRLAVLVGVAGVLVAAGLFGPARGAGIADATVHIPGAMVAPLVRAALSGTRIRLHNLGRERSDGAYLTWHEPQASFVRVGPAAGAAEAPFTLPEYLINAGPNGLLKYYVNEITVRSMGADWHEAEFRLIFRLESAGAALKGYQTAFPTSRRDIGAPDVGLKEIRLLAILPPAWRAGSISFDPVRVEFRAEVVPAGGCVHRGVNLCAELGRFERRLATIVERELASSLNREETRDRVADAVRLRLPDLMRKVRVKRFGTLTGVAAAGDRLMVTYTPR